MLHSSPGVARAHSETNGRSETNVSRTMLPRGGSTEHGSIVDTVVDVPMRSVTAPQRSVRYTVDAACRSVFSVRAAGWPKTLCRPTLISATRGRTAVTKDADVA